MSQSLGELVPDHWLRDQQFILALTRHIEKRAPEVPDQNQLFSYLWESFDAPSSDVDLLKYRNRLEELPPTALELLCGLTGDHVDIWEEHQKIWREVLARLQWDDSPKRRISLFSGAKLLANRISTGWLEPGQICRVAWLEMRADGWETIRDIEPRLQCLTVAMLSATNAYQRLAALAAFRDGPLPARWVMIENVLLQETFSWPLLIADNNISYAMPAVVAVELGAAGTDGEKAVVIDGKHTAAQDWQMHIDKARSAAIRLWEAKKGTDAGAFEKMVRDTRVTLDLRFASTIFEKEFPAGQVALVDGSLGTYVALEVLSQFFGLTTAGQVAATGVLGRPISNGQGRHKSRGGNYSVVRVRPEDGWIDAKVECARRSFFFDKVIVPGGATPVARPGHLQVLQGGTLEDYAKEALGQHWRNHRYVRCVDIAETFKAEKAGLGAIYKREQQSRQAKDILRRCNISRSPILELDDRFTGADVAHALYWSLEDAKDDPSRPFAHIPAYERRGHFAFVRASIDEQSERFWATIWDVCGGSVQSFHDFTRSTSVAQAARHLEALLNMVRPVEDRRSPAPDVLVIIGANRLAARNKHVTENDNPTEIFRLARLINHLRAHDALESCANPVLQAQLPKVRLILVNENEVPRIPITADILPPELRPAFFALSIFRHGFTLPMAQSVLRLDRSAAEELLYALYDCCPAGVHLLGLSDRTGEYWLNHEPVWRDRGGAFKAHINAATAISGFLDRSDRPQHHDFSEALKPESLHEAQWHVEQAIRLAMQASDEKRAKTYRERLSRIGEPFTWSHLTWINRNSREAGMETWQAIRDATKSIGLRNLHPLRLLLVARFAHGLSRRQTGRERYFASACRRILSFALNRCASLPEPSAKAAAFSILTARAWMTMKAKPHIAGAALAAHDNAQAWAYYHDALEIPYAEWFEQCGDASADTAEACGHYACGFLNPRLPSVTGLRLSVMVKWLGCRALLRQPIDPSDWHALNDALSEDHKAELRNWARTGRPPRSGLADAPAAKLRWVAGMKLLLSERVF